MARIVLPVLGAVVGAYFGNPQLGWMIGSLVGNAVDPKTVKGPSVGDLVQQTAQGGGPIPIVFGLSLPIAGNVIDTDVARVVKSKKKASKGGPKVESESVYRTYAIGVCRGPIGGFVRVWRNGSIVYDNRGVVDETSQQRQDRTNSNTAFLKKARFFLGDYAQNPSPDLEVIYGVGTTPAHRGIAYMVVKDDDLTDTRGAIPQYVFQISVEDPSPGPLVLQTPGPNEGHTYLMTRPSSMDPNREYTMDLALPTDLASQEGLVMIVTVPITERVGGVGDIPQVGDAGPKTGLVTYGGIALSRLLDSHTGYETHDGAHGGGMPMRMGIFCLPLDAHPGLITGTHEFKVTVDGYGDAMPIVDPFTSHIRVGFVFVKNADQALAANPAQFGATTYWIDTRDGGGFVARYIEYKQNPLPYGQYPAVVPLAGLTVPDYYPLLHGDMLMSISFATPNIDNGLIPTPGLRPIFEPPTGPSSFSSAITDYYNPADGQYHAKPVAITVSTNTTDAPISGRYGINLRTGEDTAGAGAAVTYYGSKTYMFMFKAMVGGGFPLGSFPLSDIVTAICNEAGLSQIDVSELEDILCSGFTINNQYPASAALEALSQVFLFDPVQVDGVVKFVLRGGDSVATIVEADMIDDGNEIEQSKRGDDITIPKALHLNYQDVKGGIATDLQTSERFGDRRSVGEQSLQTPVVLDADTAAKVVSINHKLMVEALSNELKFSLPDNWLRLVPTNPIIVQYNGKSLRVRITKCDLFDGYQAYTCVRDRQSNYTSAIQGIPAVSPTPPPSGNVGPTLLQVLDIPLLSDGDDGVGLGYYIAVAGVTEAWAGAQVDLSRDAGANYIEGDSTGAHAIIGELAEDLPDHPQSYPDQTHTARIRLLSFEPELEPTDLASLFSGANLCIIGDELIQFLDAEETATPDVWDISYLLRGRKGTRTGPHSAGERFVLLDRTVLNFIPAQAGDLNQTLVFRAITSGGASSDATTFGILFRGRTQVERDVGNLETRKDGSNLIITWQGVGRIGSGAGARHGVRFTGYRVTVSDDIHPDITVETTDETLTQDISGLTEPIFVQVRQINAFTDDAIL
jgi:Putative phage tail protein